MATKEEELHDEIQLTTVNMSVETLYRLFDIALKLNRRVGDLEDYVERLENIEAGPR